MMNKYNIDFSASSIKQTYQRITNQIYRLLPLREEDKDWKNPLQSLIVEIAGMCEIFSDQQVLYLELLSRLEGLNSKDFEYEVFRRTIFKSLNILKQIGDEQCL